MRSLLFDGSSVIESGLSLTVICDGKKPDPAVDPDYVCDLLFLKLLYFICDRNIQKELAVFGDNKVDRKKKVSALSDGTKMKVILANVLARKTELLIMDEPASPLDPLMRDKLWEIIQTYIEEGHGERSVFFSTHNVSDMENVTDYAIIMEHGQIVEEGMVEDLK